MKIYIVTAHIDCWGDFTTRTIYVGVNRREALETAVTWRDMYYDDCSYQTAIATWENNVQLFHRWVKYFPASDNNIYENKVYTDMFGSVAIEEPYDNIWLLPMAHRNRIGKQSRNIN